jgi:phage gp46-like protein
MKDLTIYETGTGGDVQIKAGDLSLSSGFVNQIYLALFGTDSYFWGEAIVPTAGTFQTVLNNTVLNSGGLSIIENAAMNALAYLKEFSEISVTASITGINRLQITINQKYVFVWDAANKEIIETFQL